MKTIYIDQDYKCFTTPADSRREVKTNIFDGKCVEYIDYMSIKMLMNHEIAK